MTAVTVISLTLVGLVGTAVAASRDPEAQAVTLSGFGLTLTILFVVLQAPDVALSQLVIGAAVVPLMVMLALRAIGRRSMQQADGGNADDGGRQR